VRGDCTVPAAVTRYQMLRRIRIGLVGLIAAAALPVSAEAQMPTMEERVAAIDRAPVAQSEH
jgi:hypothetical protein